MTRRRPTPSSPRARTIGACALAAAALAAAALPSSAAAAPGSGTGAWVWVLAAIGAVVLVFTLLRLRSSRGGSRISMSDISDGRQILIARGRRITEDLTNLTDTVSEREDEGITRMHERALEVVAEVRSNIGRTSGQRVQARAHHDLDEAEWLLGGLRARLDGFVEPLENRSGFPAVCFFDGSHGLATVDVDLGGIALQRIPVRTCAPCAVGLVRGELPTIGTVEMGGRAVLWPSAPRWCGSYGWAAKDLKHLHYDGDPLFTRGERPTKRHRSVSERARGVRARVLPATTPVLLPEDDPSEFLEPPVPVAETESPETHDVHAEAPAMSSAFAAMESEPPSAEPATRALDPE